MTDKLLFSKYEAAQMLGLGIGRLDVSIRKGELAVRRVGRRVLLTRQALEEFARAQDSQEMEAGVAQ